MVCIISVENLSKKSKKELLELVVGLQDENEILRNLSSITKVGELSTEEIRDCIVEFIRHIPDGEKVSAEEIAKEYGADIDDVKWTMETMAAEGYLQLCDNKIDDFGKPCAYNHHGAKIEFNETTRKIYIGFEMDEYVTELNRDDVRVLITFLEEHKNAVDNLPGLKSKYET